MDDRREPLYIFGRANPPIEQRGQSPPNRGDRYRRHGVVMGGPRRFHLRFRTVVGKGIMSTTDHNDPLRNRV